MVEFIEVFLFVLFSSIAIFGYVEEKKRIKRK